MIWTQFDSERGFQVSSFTANLLECLFLLNSKKLMLILILSGEIENMLTKTQRNETEQQKHRIRLGCNQDGIIEVSLNATDLEIGFMEVVGSATLIFQGNLDGLPI